MPVARDAAARPRARARPRRAAPRALRRDAPRVRAPGLDRALARTGSACSRSPTRRTSTRCASSACSGGESVGCGRPRRTSTCSQRSRARRRTTSSASRWSSCRASSRRAARRPGGTHAAHGYGGVGREGSIDSMVLTELAWEDEELARRMLEGELLFYSREQAPQEPRRVHHVVIDASASMRGEREIFARGLAIALGKKLQLGGEEVCDALLRLAPLRRPACPRSRRASGGLAPRLQGRARTEPGAGLRAARDRDRAAARPATRAIPWSTSSRTRRSTSRGTSCRRSASRRICSQSSSCRAAERWTSSGSTSSRATPSWTTPPCSKKAPAPPPLRRLSAERARGLARAGRRREHPPPQPLDVVARAGARPAWWGGNGFTRAPIRLGEARTLGSRPNQRYPPRGQAVVARAGARPPGERKGIRGTPLAVAVRLGEVLTLQPRPNPSYPPRARAKAIRASAGAGKSLNLDGCPREHPLSGSGGSNGLRPRPPPA